MNFINNTKLTKRDYIIVSIIIALLISIIRYGSISADSYFMAVQGKDLLNGGWNTSKDIFSIHSNGTFYHQKWATCIMTYLLMDRWGNEGIDIVTSVIIFFITFSIFIFLYDLCNNNKELALLTSSSIMSLTFINATLRPQLFSTWIMAIEIYILEKYSKGEIKPIYVYASLTACSIATMWFHSTMWVLCILVVEPYLFNFKTKYCEKRNYKKSTIFISLILMTAGSILQPNGLSQYHYMFVCIKGITPEYQIEVPELDVLSVFSTAGLTVIATIIIYITVTWKNKRYFIPHALIIIGLGILTFRANRIFFVYGIIYGIVFAATITDMKININIPTWRQFLCPSLFLIVITICSAIFAPGRRFYNGEGEISNKHQYWEDIIIDLQKHDIRDGLKIYVSAPEIGSYGMIKGMKPYFDCRFEVYDDAINEYKNIIEEHRTFMDNLRNDKENGLKYILQMQDEYNFDYWILFKLDNSNDACSEVLKEDNGKHSQEICSNATFVVYKVFE